MLSVIRNNLALLKYLLVAITGVMINLVVSEALQSQLGLGFTRSLALGYLAGMIFGFFATRAFAFNAREPYSIRREAVKYIIVSLIALLVTSISGTVVLIVTTWGIKSYPKTHDYFLDFLNWFPILPTVVNRDFVGRIGGICFGFFINYFGHRFFTFRNTGTVNFVLLKKSEFIARRK
jgi:putative flippase GtrA